MEQPGDCRESPTAAPVFVDDSGRRGALARRSARILVVGFAGYLGLLGTGLTGDPRLGSVHLPTFELPGRGLAAPPPPSVLGEQTTPADPPTEVAAGSPAGTAGGTTTLAPATAAARPRLPVPATTAAHGGAGPAAANASGTRRAEVPAPPATAPTNPGQSANSTTPPTSPTRATPPAAPGSGVVSAKGPHGSGPPGQERKAARTSTTGPRATG